MHFQHKRVRRRAWWLFGVSSLCGLTDFIHMVLVLSYTNDFDPYNVVYWAPGQGLAGGFFGLVGSVSYLASTGRHRQQNVCGFTLIVFAKILSLAVLICSSIMLANHGWQIDAVNFALWCVNLAFIGLVFLFSCSLSNAIGIRSCCCCCSTNDDEMAFDNQAYVPTAPPPAPPLPGPLPGVNPVIYIEPPRPSPWFWFWAANRRPYRREHHWRHHHHHHPHRHHHHHGHHGHHGHRR